VPGQTLYQNNKIYNKNINEDCYPDKLDKNIIRLSVKKRENIS
jgi:hypothetical protein